MESKIRDKKDLRRLRMSRRTDWTNGLYIFLFLIIVEDFIA